MKEPRHDASAAATIASDEDEAGRLNAGTHTAWTLAEAASDEAEIVGGETPESEYRR